MCGIVGFISKTNDISSQLIQKTISRLLVLSEIRGKEASGVAIFSDKKNGVFKRDQPAKQMTKTEDYCDFMKNHLEDFKWVSILGHSRLVTNGSQENHNNNQPIGKSRMFTVHNGVIVNADELWQKNPCLLRESDLDSEILVALTEKHAKKSSFIEGIKKTYNEIEGMASTLNFDFVEKEMVAASNNGSLYYIRTDDDNTYLFASELMFLKQLFKTNENIAKIFRGCTIHNLKANKFISIKLPLDFKKGSHLHKVVVNSKSTFANKMIETNLNKCKKFDIDSSPIKKIKRCTKCVLPETMPFIEFDSDGVCNYCKTYKKQHYLGKEALLTWACETKKNKKTEKDSLVSFSGGRDSSYGLHYFVKELGLNPVCYSYDWGMLTDLARRNQSRMCANLGVELIIVSADIKKKRKNISDNVSAWLKNPDLGMIPIFMAGDKQYFYYANKIRKIYSFDEVLMASNPFEKTHFKSGFCNSRPAVLDNKEIGEVEHLSLSGIFNMAFHYSKQYLKNPSYFNSSIFDTVSATFCYYAIPHNYFRLFNYIPWEEKTVNETLLKTYGWEVSKNSESTWRIGDGTAPFYNYIYYKIAGFTENDTLRSNQIREGQISREQALKLVEIDNAPNFEALKWYFETINIDMFDALNRIDKMEKLY